MINFVYGPDDNRSDKKVKEITARQKEIHNSGLSFNILHADEDDFDVFRNAVGSVSMFGEKKLVALKGLSNSKEFTEMFKKLKRVNAISERLEEKLSELDTDQSTQRLECLYLY